MGLGKQLIWNLTNTCIGVTVTTIHVIRSNNPKRRRKNRAYMTLPSRPILSPNFRLVWVNGSKLITVEGVTSINLQKEKGKPWFELHTVFPQCTSMVTHSVKELHLHCKERIC